MTQNPGIGGKKEHVELNIYQIIYTFELYYLQCIQSLFMYISIGVHEALTQEAQEHLQRECVYNILLVHR